MDTDRAYEGLIAVKSEVEQQCLVPPQRSPEPDGPGNVQAPSLPTESSEHSAGAVSPPAVGIAFCLTVILLVVVTLLSVQSLHRSQAERAANQALVAARSYASAVTSYDYRDLDRGFATALTGATGPFKSQYLANSQLMRLTLGRAHSVSKGTVLDAGIASQTEQQVTVVLFVDQSVTNGAQPQPHLIRSRMIMTLVPRDGRWLVNQLELR